MTHSFAQKLLDHQGQLITSDNPLATTQQLKIDAVIDDTAHDLNAAAYSETVTPTYDYIIDNIALDFTTSTARTITLTSDNGTEIYKSENNTNLSVAVSSINFGQTAGQSFTLAITSTAAACSVDVTANIKNSPVALTADPVLAEGTNTVGKFVLVDEGGLPAEVDNSTHSLQTITYEHHEIHSGSHYYVSGHEILPDTDEVIFGFTTPDSTKWIHMTFEISGTSRTDFHIYEDSAITGGTSSTPFNNNRNSTKTSDSTVVFNPTVNTQGTEIYSESRGFEGTNKIPTSGGGITRDREIILKQNTTYTFVITSHDDDNNVSYLGEWYEHTNKD